MIDEGALRRLSAGRWLIPLMALVAAEDGSRFAVMRARLALSRSALSASLAQLLKNGWLQRNPGHGHPLRPEYVPETETGAPIGALAQRLMEARDLFGFAPRQVSRWSLPTVVSLATASARFSELQKALDPVTPRALSLTLKQLAAEGLISRTLEDSFPPTAIYSLTRRGRRFVEAMGGPASPNPRRC